MTAPCPPAQLLQQTMYDIIDLQGREIVRLREELAQLKDRYAALLQSSQPKAVSKTISGSGENETGDSTTVNPSDPDSSITPFCSDEYVHEHLKAAKNIIGKKRMIIVSKAMMWMDNYASGIALRPSGRMTQKGRWIPSTHKKLTSQCHLVAQMSGQSYYLGVYDHVSTEVLSPDEYSKLPMELQRDLIALSGDSKYSKELAQKLINGEIPVNRFYLRRGSFNVEVQNALLKVKADHQVEQDGGSEGMEEAEDSED